MTDKNLRPAATTGHIRQHPYDPFASPDRARSEELGEVLAEGLSWLMDQDRAIAEGDQLHWSGFLPRRADFLRSVLELVEKSGAAIFEKERQAAALRGALDRLSLITPALCERYLKAWAVDRRQWQLHLDQLPTGLARTAALTMLARPGSAALTWRLPERDPQPAGTIIGPGAVVG